METGMRYQSKIVCNGIRTINDKDAISITFETNEGECGEALIWVTERSVPMAKAALKACGFDAATQQMADLIEDPVLLQGNAVTIEADEYNGKQTFRVVIPDAPSAKRLKELQGLFGKPKTSGKPAQARTPAAVPVNQSEGESDEDSIPF